MRRKSGLSLSAIVRARCPACHTGKITKGFFEIRHSCSVCQYNFHPEPGFYLGAIAVGFLVTAVLTIPPTILLKLMKVDIELLVAFPFLEFLLIGPFILFYARVVWLHLAYQMSERLDGGEDGSKDRG